MRLEQLLAPYRPPDTHLVDRLRYWVREQPDTLACGYLQDTEQDAVCLSYRELDAKARAVAAYLVERGYQGQRGMLLFPPGIDFVVALLACFYAQVIAVPAYPPRRNRNMDRLSGIADDCHASVALTVSSVAERTDWLLQPGSRLSQLEWVATDSIPTSQGEGWTPLPLADPHQLALLQYTSGSTGSPKGVMLSHANLIHNCSLITMAFSAGREAIGASWLPTYHDMGLIGGVLNPLYIGRPMYLMSPMSFLQKPIRWLEAVTKYRVTISGGPNFAYDQCVRKVSEEELDRLDLSSWQLAFNGAEPVRYQTLREFADKFARCGFRYEAFYPCYGMAETTLIVTGGHKHSAPVTRCFDRSNLDEGRVASGSPDDARGRMLVGCGQLLPTEEVLIVDPDTCIPTPKNYVGEVWVRSPSVGQGYWEKPEVTQETFRARLAGGGDDREFLRTGDLGFFHQDELFITGRLKDMILVRGVNRYPQDIEMTVEQADSRLRNGATAAFAVEIDGRERLVVVSEVERGLEDDWDALIDQIRKAVTRDHELPPDAVVLVRTGSIPKTSSGKIQRHACREGFLDNSLLVLARRCNWEDEGPPLQAAASRGDVSTAGGAVRPEGKRVERMNGHARRSAVATGREERVAGSGERADDHIVQRVIQAVQEVGRERARRVLPETNIVELGLDSLERLEIINILEDHFGGRLPEEVLPEIETCQQVADAIAEHIPQELLEAEAAPREIPLEFRSFAHMPEYRQLKRNMELLLSTGEPNPYFKVHQGVTRDTALIDGRVMLSFATYNYLGMSGHPEVTAAAQEAAAKYGTSVSASRLVSGQKPLHAELEREIAEFLGVEDSITFVGGHSTNETTIGHLFGSGDLILHDALAHNSIIQGAILSGARRRPFPHNDWQALDDLLTEIRGQYRRVLVVIEGVYSMDGDYSDLARFVEVKQKHQAFLMVDEAHSLGTMGATGRGMSEFAGVPAKSVDLWMGTLSKSFGSCGGFIGGCREVIEYLRYTAPGFVFSVGLSPPNAASALASLRVLRREPELARRCLARAARFLARARERGLDTGFAGGTPIVPVILGNSLAALQLSRRLFERGINVQPILYPAVEESAARLRFFLTACHHDDQIDQTVDAVAEELRRVAPRLLRVPPTVATPTLASPAVAKQ
ncbi:MAG: aminotransferase class I/II-fold pyridoxal phosphate-dependent enzyme [Pirellulales bacterium]